jgi:ribosome-associated protein
MKKKSTAKHSPLAVIINALDDFKAQNIIAIDVTRLSDVMDTLVIASGSSNRQVRALAQHAADEAKKNGAPAMGMEGLDDGEWALVDFGDVVLHVMQPEVRDFYELEKLWLIPGNNETLDLTALSAKKASTQKMPAKKSVATPKTAPAKKPGNPVTATKKPARKKVADDVLVSQSDASKARQRKTATNARKKAAAKPAAAATPAKAGIYAKTGTRKPVAAKSTTTKASSKKTATAKTSTTKTTAAKSTAKKSAAPTTKSASKKATGKSRAPRKA